MKRAVVDGVRAAAGLGLVLLSLACSSGSGPEAPSVAATGPEYVAEIERFRSEREARLRAPDGWLTLVGLYWLQPGDNRVGTDPSSEILLPPDSAPAEAAVLRYEDGRVRMIARSDPPPTIDDEPASEAFLAADSAGSPDLVRTGRVTFYIINRGGRLAVRVKDPEARARTEFRGLEYFPVDPAYRVVGRLKRYPDPEPRQVATAVGTTEGFLAPGIVRFELEGRELGLEPLIGEPDDTELFVVFRDLTSGTETYGGGRFLGAELDGDEVVLDFNRAYNPPCAFTAFATCPLPPAANRLDVEVRAGERAYHGTGAHDPADEVN